MAKEGENTIYQLHKQSLHLLSHSTNHSNTFERNNYISRRYYASNDAQPWSERRSFIQYRPSPINSIN